MNIEAKKNELIQWILHLDEDTLNKIDTIMQRTITKNSVAYSVEGKPFTLSEYFNELEEAEKEIDKGEYLTSDELEKEMSSWVK